MSSMIHLLSIIVKAGPEAREALGAPHANVSALHAMVKHGAIRGLVGRHDQVLADVLSLNEEILNFSRRRNDIAHALVDSYNNGKNSDVYLQPAFTTTRSMKNHDTPEYLWNAEQLREFTNHFERMTGEANALGGEIVQLRRGEEERRLKK